MSRQELFYKLFVRLQDIIKNESKKKAKQFLSNYLKQLNNIESSMRLENNSSFFAIASIAVQKECKVVIELLIELGININAIDNNGNTLLHLCAYKNLFPLHSDKIDKIAELLLKNNANPNVKNKYGKTSLHIISQKHHKRVFQLFKLLIQHQADVNAVDINGRTSLFYCIKYRNFYMTKFLLEHNADVNHPDSQGITPIFIIPKLSSCDVEFYNLFFQYEVNVHTVNNKQQTLLHIFAEKGYTKFLQHVINLGININAVDSEGKTALHVAVNCNYEVVECLLKNNIDINIADKYCRTALFYSFMHLDSLIYFFFNLPIIQSNTNLFIDRIKKSAEIIENHVIKMKCAGLFIDEQNLNCSYAEYCSFLLEDKISYLKQFTEYRNLCLAEVKKLQINIGQSNVTYFDILAVNVDKLAKYAKNDSILEILNGENCINEYPIYINMIKSHFAQGIMRLKLLDIAQICFISSCSNILSNLCTDKIFSYLQNHDLMNFITAVIPNSRFNFKKKY